MQKMCQTIAVTIMRGKTSNLDKKKKTIEIIKEELFEEQKKANRAKVYDFYAKCYQCRICGKIHDPISLRSFDQMPNIFDMAQILADRYAGRLRYHGIKNGELLNCNQ